MTDLRHTFDLAVASHQAGDFKQAEDLYRQILQIEPKNVHALHGLGMLAHQTGRNELAVDYLQRALRLAPNHAIGQFNFGVVLQAQGRSAEARDCWQRAIQLKPDYAEAHNNLGCSFRDQRNFPNAERCFRGALRLQPGNVQFHCNLGFALESQGKLTEAEVCYVQAVRLKPDYAQAHYHLGFVLLKQGKLTDAIGPTQRALQLMPTYADACLNLGVIHGRRGDQDQALTCLRRAIELNPNATVIWNSYLHALHYSPQVTLRQLHQEHLKFERLHAAPLRTAWRAHENVRNPDRPLRLGFISPNFAMHPVGYFLIRIFENLNRAQAEVACYSDTLVKDSMTQRLRACATHWTDVVGWSDDQLATKIRSDQIDILFDLAGHAGGNRLLVFARKPAPIQITWMDYVGTTGLTAMDYILADPREIPPESEQWYVEKVLRMPDDYICYEPPAGAPPVGLLPALTNGFVTFGSFNLLNKITTPTLQTWARILHRVPQSRLIIKYRGLEDPGTADRFSQAFRNLGIAPERLQLEGKSPHAEMSAHYQCLDIALDPFPYNGGLTTCEAMWMGVPVITCPTETFAGRHALSHLSTAGLTETIARDADHYVDIAAELAQNLPRLAAIRSQLREQMASSSLCNGKRFADNLMVLMRDVWHHWVNR